MPKLPLSLFELLRDELGDAVPITKLSKATLVNISHTLEDHVLRKRLDALLFTGFQESAHWREEIERYLALANVARQVCIFAGQPLPPDSTANSLHITLNGDDPLRQEWFLLILSNAFAVLLCGQDQHTPFLDELDREFDTFWTFEPSVINRALDRLEGVIAEYRPDKLALLRQARQEIPPPAPDVRFISEFSLDIIRYQEALNRRLRVSEQRFSQLVTAIPHHIYAWQIDAQGVPFNMFKSPNLTRLSGYPIEAFYQDYDFWLDRVIHLDDRTRAREQLHRLYAGEDSVCEYRIVHADGRVLWVQDSARAFRDPQNGLMTVYGVIDDITERRRLADIQMQRERLRVALQKERELNHLKTTFMTTVSHEFRTPLAIILSTAETLDRYLERMSVEDNHRRLKTIMNQVEELREMLDGISSIMAVDSGEVLVTPSPTNLCELLQQSIDKTHSHDETRHTFVVHFTDCDRVVYLDGRLTRQIVDILLANAVKYSPDGGSITCALEITEDDVMITISDEGIGVPEADQQHLFKAFFRASNVGTIGGVGLGLKLVKDYAELMGGSITFHSMVGQGTTFTVILPLV